MSNGARITQELDDMSVGRFVNWKAEELPPPSLRSPIEFKGSGTDHALRVGSALAKSVGQQRRRAVLCDLLDLARWRKHSHHVTHEHHLTDMWVSSIEFSVSRRAGPAQPRPPRLEITTNTAAPSVATPRAGMKSRVAWIDLSAGPFRWGETYGGRGVRSETSLPRVPTLHRQDKMASHNSKGLTVGRAEVRLMERLLKRKLKRLRAVFGHLGCSRSKARSSASVATIGSRSRTYPSAMSCRALEAQVWMLRTFATASPKLNRYDVEIQSRQQMLGPGSEVHELDQGELRVGYVQLLLGATLICAGRFRLLKQYFEENSSFSSTPEGIISTIGFVAHNQEHIVAATECTFLSRIAGIVGSFASHVMSPASAVSVPDLSKMTHRMMLATRGISRIELSETRNSGKLSVTSWEQSLRSLLWSHTFMPPSALEFHVVRTHNQYDPFDVQMDGRYAVAMIIDFICKYNITYHPLNYILCQV